MDQNTQYLVSYGTSLNFESLPEDVVERTKLLLVDQLGIAVAGYTGEPAKIARRMAEWVRPEVLPATVLGTGYKSTLEMATFANGVMMRDPEFNDTLIRGSRGHPSDNFAPLLAVGEAFHSGGKDFIVASVLAFEVVGQLAREVRRTSPLIDHAFSQGVSATVGAAKLMGLADDQWEQAINIAVGSNIALYQTRCGEMSMWKSGAVPYACRNGVFGALLAREGFTGASPIFEGRGGLFNALHGPFKLANFGGDGRPFEISNTAIKRFPVNIAIQSPVEAALRLRSKVGPFEGIKKIQMETWAQNAELLASDTERFRPRTRDTADHSAPYCIALAFKYGHIDAEQFEEEEFREDPDLIALMQKISVVETPNYTKLYPTSLPTRLTVETAGGVTHSEEVVNWRGHPADHFTKDDVEEKFLRLTKGRLSAAQRRDLLAFIWDLDQMTDVGEIAGLMRI